MISVRTFCLECGNDGLYHPCADAFALTPLHEVDVEVRRIITLQLSRKKELDVVNVPNQFLPR